MNKKIKLITGIVCFTLLIAGAYFLYEKLSDEYSAGGLVQDSHVQDDSKPEDTSSENVPANESGDTGAEIMTAPDFTVIDGDGKEIKLSDMIGKPVVVNFWASWCPPCKAEMPDFNEAYELYGEEITFMMVNMTDGSRETVDIAKEFIASTEYTFPVYFDTEYSAAIAYSVYSLPSSYFIDADGNLVAHAIGMIDSQTLAKGIGMIR